MQMTTLEGRSLGGSKHILPFSLFLLWYLAEPTFYRTLVVHHATAEKYNEANLLRLFYIITLVLSNTDLGGGGGQGIGAWGVKTLFPWQLCFIMVFSRANVLQENSGAPRNSRKQNKTHLLRLYFFLICYHWYCAILT